MADVNIAYLEANFLYSEMAAEEELLGHLYPLMIEQFCKAGQGYAFVNQLKLDGLSVDNLLHSDLVKAKQLRFFCSSCHQKEPRRIS